LKKRWSVAWNPLVHKADHGPRDKDTRPHKQIQSVRLNLQKTY
jgi:hypothetical protein